MVPHTISGMGNYKDRVRAAMARHHERQLKAEGEPKRKNKAPEKEVERECLEWMRRQGWSVNVFEAKATWDKRGFYRGQAMKEGTPDCIGCDSFGTFVAVEFKAPGRLSTLRPLQRKYLVEKIERGAFAAVVDSASRLQDCYELWRDCVKNGANSVELLLGLLPFKKSEDDLELDFTK